MGIANHENVWMQRHNPWEYKLTIEFLDVNQQELPTRKSATVLEDDWGMLHVSMFKASK